MDLVVAVLGLMALAFFKQSGVYKFFAGCAVGGFGTWYTTNVANDYVHWIVGTAFMGFGLFLILRSRKAE